MSSSEARRSRPKSRSITWTDNLTREALVRSESLSASKAAAANEHSLRKESLLRATGTPSNVKKAGLTPSHGAAHTPGDFDPIHRVHDRPFYVPYSLFEAEKFEEESFDIREFMDTLTYKLMNEAQKLEGGADRGGEDAFLQLKRVDSEDWQRLFSCAVEELKTTLREVDDRIDETEHKCGTVERKHAASLKHMKHCILDMEKEIKGLESRVEKAGIQTVQVGEELASVDVQLQRSREARNIIDYYMQFGAWSGDMDDTVALSAVFTDEKRVHEAAEIIVKLQSFAQEVSIPGIGKALQNIHKYSEQLEQRLLSQFSEGIQSLKEYTKRTSIPAALSTEVRLCAEALINFNGGMSCFTLYINTRDVFIHRYEADVDLQKDIERIEAYVHRSEALHELTGVRNLLEHVRKVFEEEFIQIQEIFGNNSTKVLQSLCSRLFEETIHMNVEYVMNQLRAKPQLRKLYLTSMAIIDDQLKTLCRQLQAFMERSSGQGMYPLGDRDRKKADIEELKLPLLAESVLSPYKSEYIVEECKYLDSVCREELADFRETEMDTLGPSTMANTGSALSRKALLNKAKRFAGASGGMLRRVQTSPSAMMKLRNEGKMKKSKTVKNSDIHDEVDDHDEVYEDDGTANVDALGEDDLENAESQERIRESSMDGHRMGREKCLEVLDNASAFEYPRSVGLEAIIKMVYASQECLRRAQKLSYDAEKAKNIDCISTVLLTHVSNYLVHVLEPFCLYRMGESSSVTPESSSFSSSLFSSKSQAHGDSASASGVQVMTVSNHSQTPYKDASSFFVVSQINHVMQKVLRHMMLDVEPHLRFAIVTNAVDVKARMLLELEEKISQVLSLKTEWTALALKSCFAKSITKATYNPPEETFTIDNSPSQACQRAVSIVSRCIDDATGHLDGENIAVFLGRFGSQICRVVHNFLFNLEPQTVSCIGAVQLLRDLSEYRRSLQSCTVVHPDLIVQLDLLKQLSNVLMVAPKNLKALLDETPVLKELGVDEVDKLLQVRSDYKVEKLRSLLAHL